MKIVVDREDIQTIYNMMEDPCEGTVCVEVRGLLRKILDENPSESERVICSSCGELVDLYFHTCPGLNNYFFESAKDK